MIHGTKKEKDNIWTFPLLKSVQKEKTSSSRKMTIFSIVGDSNVRRFLSSVNKRACPDLENAQILTCMKAPLLPEALSQVNADCEVVIVTCVTNFITDATGSSTISAKVEPVITKFLDQIACSSDLNPDRLYLVGPPMFRSRPGWYREGLSEILTKFSSVMTRNPPAKLKLMPR